MSDQAIDPTEIILDKRKTYKEDNLYANPWIRFLSRFFDYAWFILILWGARILLQGHLPLGKYESLVPFEFLAWIPIEAIFLSTLGSTPGKLFLKIKLRQGMLSRLNFPLAIKRSFNVWFRGLGMMIPLINSICLLLAYYRLKTFRTTTWDQGDHLVVSHSPIGTWRIIACAIFTSFVFFFYFSKNLSKN